MREGWGLASTHSMGPAGAAKLASYLRLLSQIQRNAIYFCMNKSDELSAIPEDSALEGEFSEELITRLRIESNRVRGTRTRTKTCARWAGRRHFDSRRSLTQLAHCHPQYSGQ